MNANTEGRIVCAVCGAPAGNRPCSHGALVEQLRKENERLRAALEHIAAKKSGGLGNDEMHDCIHTARAALKQNRMDRQ